MTTGYKSDLEIKKYLKHAQIKLIDVNEKKFLRITKFRFIFNIEKRYHESKRKVCPP